MLRRLSIIAAAIVALLVAADIVLWRMAEQWLQAGVAEWAQTQRENGWTVAAGPPSRGGWPFAARLTLPGFRLAGGEQDIPGGLDWRAEQISLQLDLFHPHRLLIAGHGTQYLRLARLPDLPFSAERLEAAIPLQADKPPHGIDIVAEHLRIHLPPREEATELGVTGATLHLQTVPAATRDQAAISFVLRAREIDLPSSYHWALGPHIPTIEADGAINGPLPPLAPLPVRLAAWRDKGGMMILQRLATVWGPLGLTASATITLDAQLQPMGAIAARITGEVETLDKLAEGGAIAPSAATVAKALLGLMPHTTGADGKPQIDIRLTLQDRTFRLGQIPLARIPEFDWSLNAATQR